MERPGREEVAQAVRAALARTLRRPLEDIQPGCDLESDLGLDSMALIEVNIAIEELLRVPVPAGETPELAVRTVDDLVSFVLDRAGCPEAAPC
jgi:acyl carrier protein